MFLSPPLVFHYIAPSSLLTISDNYVDFFYPNGDVSGGQGLKALRKTQRNSSLREK